MNVARLQLEAVPADATLMRFIRLISDSRDVLRLGYSHPRGLLLQCRHWFAVIGGVEYRCSEELLECGLRIFISYC
jgi:hypothetical protein